MNAKLSFVLAFAAACVQGGVDHSLSGTLLPEIAENVLAQMAQGKAIERIKVSAAKNGDFKYTVA